MSWGNWRDRVLPPWVFWFALGLIALIGCCWPSVERMPR